MAGRYDHDVCPRYHLDNLSKGVGSVHARHYQIQEDQVKSEFL